MTPSYKTNAPAAPALRRWLGALAACVAASLAAGPAAAAATAEPGEVMLVLRSADAVTPLLAKYSLTVAGRFGARPIFRLKAPKGTNLTTLVTNLSAETGVLVAERNFRHANPESVKNNVWAIGTPTMYANQWAPTAIGLSTARTLASGGGVRVAVLDTGFDLQHPKLVNRWLPGWDFVDGDADPSDTTLPTEGGHGHGTHVAGLIARVAPGARLMPLRVLDSEGSGNAWVLAEALLFAVDPDRNPATQDGAQVINLSMAGVRRTRLMDTITALAGCNLVAVPTPALDMSDPGYNEDRQRCNLQGGSVVVAGAGNDGSASLRTYPAAESSYGLLAVAASRADGRLATFSNSGNWIHLAAPGEAVTSTVPGGGYATWSGTSMATPLVAGAAALVRQRHPDLAARDVARCLEASASRLAGTKLRQLNAGVAMSTLAVDVHNCR